MSGSHVRIALGFVVLAFASGARADDLDRCASSHDRGACLEATIRYARAIDAHLASRSICASDAACRASARSRRARRPDPRRLASALSSACPEDAVVCFHLGLVEESLGRKREAIVAFVRGCDLGDAESCFALATRARTAAIRRARIDPDRASEWTRIACDRGLADACVAIASMSSDPDERARGLASACDLGSARACTSIATELVDAGPIASAAYFVDDPGFAPTTRAFEYAREGCELGDVRACTLALGIGAPLEACTEASLRETICALSPRAPECDLVSPARAACDATTSIHVPAE